MRILPEKLWPRLQAQSVSNRLANRDRSRIRSDKIKEAYWQEHVDVAIEEARRLFDAEQERRRGADNKAGVYLAAITALIPVLATVSPFLLKEGDKLYSGVLLFFFTAALGYLLRAGLWAFETLRVSGFSQVDSIDLLSGGDQKEFRQELVRKLLLCFSANTEVTNKKVSCIKMTHEFLLRSFVSFVLTLFVSALWPGFVWGLARLYDKVSSFFACG